MTDRTGQENISGLSQKLILENRQDLAVTGVSDVVSFDENGAVLETVNGMLIIDGEALHVTQLDIKNGNVSVEGKVNGLLFSDGKNNKGRKRLFK